MAGIYIHVPFCSSFCIYCNFYSEIDKGGIIGWRSSLIEEITQRRNFFKRGVLPETLYFGGGTPSLLPLSDLKMITSHLKSIFQVDNFKEFTIEVNPDDICNSGSEGREDLVSGYKDLGVNRISMGIQSFSDDHLKWMRRRHTASEAIEAFHRLREEGFDNISIDLIFGFASLSTDEWVNNIEQAISLRPEHISCYQMSIEDGSDLYDLAETGKYIEPRQEKSARQYALLQKRLAEAGYRQYEISNFSLPGCESKHNGSYWSRDPYLGLGPGAHSFDGDRLRRWNVADTKKYNSAIESGQSYFESEHLSGEDVFNEQIMLGLRTIRGCSIKSLDKQLFAKIKPAVTQLVKAGSIIIDNDILSIPSEKLFVSDGIMGSLFIEQKE
ncbi:MAG: radical SAM family heme chaperone HemW [Bacteroidales bacterium]|nr:radical SAM family heme chaperone HemW [Bacteroidales bacterium]MDD4670075.1 radical SAM family heme chaperone HemW [Bacteroidales bacterium]